MNEPLAVLASGVAVMLALGSGLGGLFLFLVIIPTGLIRAYRFIRR